MTQTMTYNKMMIINPLTANDKYIGHLAGAAAGAIAPSTGKIMKNVPEFFERG